MSASDTPDRGEMLALSLPTFIFAGYELGRKSFLPALLMGAAHLGMAQAGLILTIIGGWTIAVEVIFGMVCDLAPDPRRRRAFWVMVGTALQLVAGVALWLSPMQGRGVGLWLAIMLTLTSGWVLSNLAHGAWALERSTGVVARGHIFGARAQAGMAGSIGFALIVLLGERWGSGTDPFFLIVALTMLGSPLAHALLVWRVEERGQRAIGSLSMRLHLANVLKPFQVCFAAPADRWLACLFLLVGAHMAVMGNSLLFIIRHRLAMPEWGTTAILVQAVVAVLGIAGTQMLLRHRSPLRIMAGVFAINLVLALALPLLPPGQAGPLMGWVAGGGITMAVDFTLLRVLLGQRLDREARRDGSAPAAAFYAGFHLPFNLGAMMATALLFHGLAWAGMDLGRAQPGMGAGLVWLTAAMAAAVSGLSLLAAVALRRVSEREDGDTERSFFMTDKKAIMN